VQPEMRFSAGSAPDWCYALAELPDREMDLTGEWGLSVISTIVIPDGHRPIGNPGAKARFFWIPACAGMTIARTSRICYSPQCPKFPQPASRGRCCFPKRM
jgi:hypothetical protein